MGGTAASALSDMYKRLLFMLFPLLLLLLLHCNDLTCVVNVDDDGDDDDDGKVVVVVMCFDCRADGAKPRDTDACSATNRQAMEVAYFIVYSFKCFI